MSGRLRITTPEDIAASLPVRGSVTTHDGYELGDWEFFRGRVERIGDGPELADWLATWQLTDTYAGMSAEDIADDMATIIDRLTPEGSEG